MSVSEAHSICKHCSIEALQDTVQKRLCRVLVHLLLGRGHLEHMIEDISAGLASTTPLHPPPVLVALGADLSSLGHSPRWRLVKVELAVVDDL